MPPVKRVAALTISLALALPASSAFAETGAVASSSSTPAVATSTSTPGVKAGDPSDTQTAVRLTKSQVKQLQRKLRVRADGSLGPRTRRKVASVNKRYGVRTDGRVTAALLSKLGLRFTGTVVVPAAASTTVPGTTTASVGVSSTSSATALSAVEAARTLIGLAYNENGFDCSKTTQWSFAKAGISLPRTSWDQYSKGVAVAKDQIIAGDLVFFNTAGSGASHVGIATSPTTIISATSSRGIIEHKIFDSYWGSHYVGARRLS